jgi:outer membrane lipoprotein-sorting protein
MDVKAVVAEVQKRYDSAADFRARFTQTLTSAAMGRKTSSSGEVMFKKPGGCAGTYEKPDKSSYISDGNRAVAVRARRQGRRSSRTSRRRSYRPALAFLTGKGKLATEFDIDFAAKARYGTPATTCCRCPRRRRSRR